MPKIAFYKYLMFFIVSYDLRERFHLHVVNTKGRDTLAAKIWLDPLEISEKGHLSKSELRIALNLIGKNRDEIKNKIRSFAKGEKSKPLSLKLNKMEGINRISPIIDKIDFPEKGSIRIYLKDGRKLITPLKFFPSIKRLNDKQRKQYHIADGQILFFDKCDEIFHIEQFLGKEQQYRYHFSTVAAEPKVKYGKK